MAIKAVDVPMRACIIGTYCPDAGCNSPSDTGRGEFNIEPTVPKN